MDTRRAERQRGSEITSDTPSSHLRECCVACAELAMVWRSGTYAGRPGHNGCHVGESILGRDALNLSRGSGALEVVSTIIASLKLA